MRPYLPEDAEAAFAIYSEPDVWRWLGGGSPHVTVDESRAWIDRLQLTDLPEAALEHERRGEAGRVVDGDADVLALTVDRIVGDRTGATTQGRSEREPLENGARGKLC